MTKPNLKLEKENENKDIKSKMRPKPKEKAKVETTSSVRNRHKPTIGEDEALKGRFSYKGSGRSTVTRSSGGGATSKKNALPITTKRPISNETNLSCILKTNKTTSSSGTPPSRNVVYLCETVKSVQEILTARSISESKSSSRKSKISIPTYNSTEQSKSFAKPWEIEQYSGKNPFVITPNSLDSTRDMNSTDKSCSSRPLTSWPSSSSVVDYDMSELRSARTSDSVNMSAKIASNFKNLLDERHRSMPVEEIILIKDVVKTDDRHIELDENDPLLFKEILKTQLQEIIKQELIVKSAINKLESTQHLKIVNMVEKSTNTVNCSLISTVQQNNKSDFVFKNVPTLENEIVILKTLGKKLEETLKRTLSEEDCDFFKKLPEIDWALGPELNAQIVMHPKGVKLVKGVIQEFVIARMTLCELKEDMNKQFYLPSNMEKTELKRTTFKKLTQNPDMLMRHLKPKSSLVSFNVLDQDPMFFNSILFNSNNIMKFPNRGESGKRNANIIDPFSEDTDIQFKIREGGDSKTSVCVPYERQEKKEPLKIEEIIFENGRTGKEIKPRVQLVYEKAESLIKKRATSSKMTENKIIIKNDEPNIVVDNAVKRKSALNIKDQIKMNETIKGIKSNKKIDSLKGIQTEEKTAASKKMKGKKPLKPDLKTNVKTVESKEKFVQTMDAVGMDRIKLFEAPIRGKYRRRIRRGITPMPMHKYTQPKNHLFKTILVGLAQISAFLVLVMAITYPDAKC